MSYGRNFSSSQQLSRDSNQDSSNSTTGAQSGQGYSRSSSFGGGWGRPQHPPAAVGGGWGRSQHPPAAVGGGCGRPQNPPAAVGGGWGRRVASTEDSRLPPQQTQSEQEQEQQPCIPTTPPEGYTKEYVSHCFLQKYEVDQQDQTHLEEVVQTYITSNPLRYGQLLKAALERALLKIHEELQTKLRKTISERDNQHPLQTMSQEFFSKLTEKLCSYGYTPPDQVRKFVEDYMKRKIDTSTMGPLCLNPSQVYTDQHMHHALHTYFLSLDLSSILSEKFGFVDGKMPSQLFRQLSIDPNVRNLIKAAMNDDGRVSNGFIIVYPPGYVELKIKLQKSLITAKKQSNYVHIVSLTSQGLPIIGDICLVIPDKIFTMTNKQSDAFSQRTRIGKPITSQYQTSGPKGIIITGMDEIIDWKNHDIPCSFQSPNMKLSMGEFCEVLCRNCATIHLFIEDEQRMTVSKQPSWHDDSPSYDDTSSAGGGWGAAAP
jgi:hypothetical protein